MTLFDLEPFAEEIEFGLLTAKDFIGTKLLVSLLNAIIESESDKESTSSYSSNSSKIMKYLNKGNNE